MGWGLGWSGVDWGGVRVCVEGGRVMGPSTGPLSSDVPRLDEKKAAWERLLSSVDRCSSMELSSSSRSLSLSNSFKLKVEITIFSPSAPSYTESCGTGPVT